MGKANSKPAKYSFKSKNKNKNKYRHKQSANSFSTISTVSTDSSNSSQESSYQSLNEEELFHYVDNRKFYKWNDYVNYVYPVDHDETDRSQAQHFMYKHVWGGKNFSSPIEQDLQSGFMKVLDIGCGSGTWVLEMATEYQNAHFTGVDIAKLYPSEIKPQNVSFVQSNVLTGLPFEDNTFDFIHMRFMLFAFTSKNWELAIKELVRVCKPGGYIELVEKDIVWYNEGPFCKAARTAMADELRANKNMEVIISPLLQKILSQYSCVNHDERVVPLGEWGGKLGKLYRDLYGWGAKNLKKVMVDIGFSEDEWNETVDICLKQLQERKGYDKIHRFWIMKN